MDLIIGPFCGHDGPTFPRSGVVQATTRAAAAGTSGGGGVPLDGLNGTASAPWAYLLFFILLMDTDTKPPQKMLH